MKIVMPIVTEASEDGKPVKGTATFDVREPAAADLAVVGEFWDGERRKGWDAYFAYEGSMWAHWRSRDVNVSPEQDFDKSKDATALMRAGHHPLATMRPDTARVTHPKLSLKGGLPLDHPDLLGSRVYRAMARQAANAMVFEGRFIVRTSGPVLCFSKASNSAVSYRDLYGVLRYGWPRLNTFGMMESARFIERAKELCGQGLRWRQGRWNGDETPAFGFDTLAYRIEALAWTICRGLHAHALSEASRAQVAAACDLRDILGPRLEERDIVASFDDAWPYERGEFKFGDQDEMIEALERIRSRASTLGLGDGLSEHLDYNLNLARASAPLPDADLHAFAALN